MLTFNVLYASWTADGQTFAGGEHKISDPSPELVKAAGSAHAAGAIEVSKGLELSHVESDEISLAKLDEAMGEWDGERWTGPWAEGNAVNASLPTAAASVAIEVEEEVD